MSKITKNKKKTYDNVPIFRSLWMDSPIRLWFNHFVSIFPFVAKEMFKDMGISSIKDIKHPEELIIDILYSPLPDERFYAFFDSDTVKSYHGLTTKKYIIPSKEVDDDVVYKIEALKIEDSMFF